MSEPPPTNSSGKSLGLVLIIVGALAIYFAGDIPQRGVGDNRDPGPRAFPVGLGVCLILGGLYELAVGARRSRCPDPKPKSLFENLPGEGTGPTARAVSGESYRDALILVVALAIYIPAISWLGFALSTGLFSAGMMLRLGARWRWAIAMSAALVVIIHLLFVTLFRVQLPAGRLGLPW